MRKQTGFVLAAVIMMGLAATFWTITGIVETTASVRSKVPAPTTPTPYPSLKELKPFY
jgi:hypothetical protein